MGGTVVLGGLQNVVEMRPDELLVSCEGDTGFGLDDIAAAGDLLHDAAVDVPGRHLLVVDDDVLPDLEAPSRCRRRRAARS